MSNKNPKKIFLIRFTSMSVLYIITTIGVERQGMSIWVFVAATLAYFVATMASFATYIRERNGVDK